MEMRQACRAAELPGLAAKLHRFTPGAVAAERQARFAGRDRRAILGLDADHASGSVAVKAGERAAQHLDALCRAQVEVGRLRLPVGHACRNAVGDEADAAHAEGRAGAEAARGDLQVLGVVLPVLHHDARHAAEALREVHLRPAFADLVGVDPVDRCRNLQARLWLARRGDHHDVVLRHGAGRHHGEHHGRDPPPLSHG